ncbi:MAG TPA: NAD(+)/NADH kinase [Actinomycetes bacterium]|nr:NAD(+)/NADH kinase [Actinomycetes bacterium]
MSATVGLIANPAAGRDIRRLTAHASVVPNHEKASIVRRVLHGLAAAGVDTVVYLADNAGIMAAAVDGGRPPVAMEPLGHRAHGWASDSTAAAGLLAAAGVGAIVTLGGDGTNRAVAAACGDVPLVAVSTGTNNVFPTMVDGTVAGLAAGLVATGAVEPDRVASRAKRVEVEATGTTDFALIDAAACTDPFVGARAIWDPGRVLALVLTRAEPWSVGLSAIGGQLRPLAPGEPAGLYVELGDGPEVVAAVAPGVVARVPVASWRLLALGEPVTLGGGARTVALDGERELAVDGGASAAVTLTGPRVVDIRATLAAAAGSGGAEGARRGGADGGRRG